MSEASEISDDSIPTSAHALQKQKEAKVLQQLEADVEAKRSLLLWISLGAIGLTGTAVGYLLGNLKGSQRRKMHRGDSSWDDEGMSDGMTENDDFAMEGAEFVRKKKRKIEGRKKEKAEDLLTSKELLDFLEEHEQQN